MSQSFAIGLTFCTLSYSYCPSLDLLQLIHLFVEVQYWQNTPVEPLLYVVLSFISVSTSQWDILHFQNSMLWVIHAFFSFVTALMSFWKSCHHCFPSFTCLLFLYKCRLLHLSLLNSILHFFFSWLFFQFAKTFWSFSSFLLNTFNAS